MKLLWILSFFGIIVMSDIAFPNISRMILEQIGLLQPLNDIAKLLK